MKNHQDPVSREPDHRERHYDLITFALAGALAVIILGAIGYGIVTSSRVASTIPQPSISPLHPMKTAVPQTRRDAPTPAPTTGSADASAKAGSAKSP